MEKNMMYPAFEIVKSHCICGKEIPIFCYNNHFYDFMNGILKDYNFLSTETINNLNVKPDIEKLSLCCLCGCRFGKTFSISIEPTENIRNKVKKDISSLPGPLSINDTLIWA